MLTNYRSLSLMVLISSVILGLLTACTDGQPPYNCAARNAEVYQVRYYPLAPSTCPPDGGYITNALYATSAGIETYAVISQDGGGGSEVAFYDVPDRLDRSATKLGIRLGTLLSAPIGNNCIIQQHVVCAKPDPDLGCSYCVLIKPGGPQGPTYSLRDGGNAVDVQTPPTPNIPTLGIWVPFSGGQKRIALDNQCLPSPPATRTSDPSLDPNLFMLLPPIGVNNICTPIGVNIATSRTVYPEVQCANSTVMQKTSIKTTLSGFELVSSAKIPGTLAKATIEFEEQIGTSVCTTSYRALFLNPVVQCSTNVDCSPIPAPSAVPCASAAPNVNDYCYTGGSKGPNQPPSGVSDVTGSGISPFLFKKYADGGYDLRDTCDRKLGSNPMQGVCIWDIDTRGL